MIVLCDRKIEIFFNRKFSCTHSHSSSKWSINKLLINFISFNILKCISFLKTWR
jgi:hypothetical protein